MSKRISPSHDEVVAALLKYEGSPNVNPLHPSGYGCVYEDHDGQHCIAGQVVVDLGGEIPKHPWGVPKNGSFDSLHVEVGEFDRRSVGLLGEAQRYADDMRPWGDVIAGLREDGLL